jgi:hypothetical protein
MIWFFRFFVSRGSDEKNQHSRRAAANNMIYNHNFCDPLAISRGFVKLFIVNDQEGNA